MLKEKRTKVLKWVKERITQDKFSCTTKPKSDQKTSKKTPKHLKLHNNIYAFPSINRDQLCVTVDLTERKGQKNK